MSTSICNSCGLPSHQRISHRDCLNNPNRLAIGNHNETEEREFNFVQTSTAISAPVCSSCGQEGHQRVTHQDCLNNPNRLAIRERNESDARDLELVHESSENAVPAHNVARVSSNTIPQRHFLGSMDIECTDCHAQLWVQERVYSSSLRRPRFNLCCQQGSVQLPELSPAPTEIIQRLHDTDPNSVHFRSNIRAYNNVLSFTSLGANIDHTVANARGSAYNFRIQGSMYHSIGSLLPNENEAPAFAQIYVLDTSSAETANRHAVAPVPLNDTILQQLQNMMHRLNPFVTSFQSMAEVSRTHGIDNVRMVIRSENTPDH
ncbi:hypothetical protein INT45_006334 [Circinella minor]|uniref:Helitron helicase-like domain-containing protein n=1 Tax=Circinella minor TaxID=1195481 RepID=A0A8H7V692_9FUNG|nr:hypothetical protein INT45_006334 [Circinella minor]